MLTDIYRISVRLKSFGYTVSSSYDIYLVLPEGSGPSEVKGLQKEIRKRILQNDKLQNDDFWNFEKDLDVEILHVRKDCIDQGQYQISADYRARVIDFSNAAKTDPKQKMIEEFA